MKKLLYFIPCILFFSNTKIINAQCLTMTCPPSVTVNAPANACAAVVAYTTPTVNCANCTSNTQTFNYTGTMQNFTVPPGITSINILARGARGGWHSSSTFSPGLGAGMRGTFAVTPGTVLKVLVGECPSITTGNGNGGGGGSFVTTLANVPLIIAGGGGGSCATTSTTARHGNISTIGGNGGAGGGIGGAAGNGGGVGGAGFQSGAGGGLLTNGATGWAAGSGGISFIGGGAGGLVAAWAFARGGYGGGGQGSAFVVGGGGGGYSGGGSGGNVTPGGGNGGGGGSYNIGTCPSNTTGINAGHGSVVFSWGTSTVVPVLTTGLISGSSFPVGTTVQTFTAGDSFGNTTSCSFSVVVNDIATPTITCPANVTQCTPIVNGIAPILVQDNCPTPAITYSFSGATAGSGANNASGSSFNVGNTTVTYMATDLSGNVGSCSFIVTTGVSSTISATATNSVICLGASTTLNGVGAATYTWSGGITNGVPFSPTVTTTYTVTGTSASGCTTTAVKTITVNPLPVIVTNSPNVCSGSNINLTATGGTGYSWSGPLGYNSLTQNPTLTNATIGMGGLYTATVTSAAGCTASANASVTVVSNPTPGLVSNSPICVGGNLTFTASGGIINLTGPNGFVSAANNPTITNVTALANGIYTLLVSAGTCTALTTTSVTINPLPVPIANSNSPVCLNQPIIFTGSGASTYTWTGPGTYSSTVQNATIAAASATNAGTYTLTVTNANGCKNSTTTNVVVNPLPIIVTNSPTACLNTNINLTATGGTGYSWSGPLGFTSALQNPTMVGTSILMTGVYTVTVTSASGCTATANASVSVVNLPTPVITSNTPCVGTALNLTGSGGVTYSWSGPNGFNSALQNPTITNVTALANGIYTLIVSAGTCTGATTSSVTINALPVPIANSNSPVCLNQPINFIGSGGTTYTWTGPGAYNVSAQNPTIAVASASNAGTYTLTVTNANGCTNSITTNVVLNPLPVIAALSNPTVCLNTTINLAANGGVGYAWSGPLGFVSAIQNPTIANATAAMSGGYTVIVTSAAGCTNSAVSTVTVLPLPTPVIVSNTPCVGSTLNLTGSGGVSYSWSGPNGFNSALQNPTIVNATLPANGNYTLVATVGSCTAITTSSVTINALPIPVATNNGPACETKSIQLTGTGTGTFLWTGPNGFNSTLQNPTLGALTNLNGGVYTVSIVDANSCVGSATTAVVVNANPVANTTNANVCFGSAATLTVSGGGTYLWSGPNGFTSTLANPQIPVVNASTSGNYTILVTAANGCTNTNVANVSFNPIPTASISGTTRACVNSTIALQGSGGFIYSWSGPSNFVSASQNLTFTASNVNMSGTYTLSVLNQAGCANYATINVIIDPLPNGTLVSDGNNSCVPFCSNFSLSPVAGNSPIVSNVWQLNNQTFTSPSLNYCFRTAGSYVVNGSFVDVNGCSNTATFAINAYPAPVADFEYTPTKPIENLDNVVFSNSSASTDITEWNWYFVNNNGYTSTQTNPSYIFEQSGTYPITLVVHNKYGCSDTIIKTITVLEEQNLYIPNSFTPNGDGINDIFLPKGKGLLKYNLMIFDRWGQKLFETSEFTTGWDGTFKGIECKQDSYVWKITASYPQGKVKEYTGHITLNR